MRPRAISSTDTSVICERNYMMTGGGHGSLRRFRGAATASSPRLRQRQPDTPSPRSGIPSCGLGTPHPKGHLGPLPRGTADRNHTTNRGGSLAHGAQAQVTWEGFACGEPAAVVAHPQHELACARLQRDDHRLSAGMLGSVVERLLTYPVERLFDCGDRLRLVDGAERDGKLVPSSNRRNLPLE